MCPEAFPVRACVSSAIDLLKNRADSKGLKLSYTIAEDVPEVIVQDVVRFKQILINLLSNAISIIKLFDFYCKGLKSFFRVYQSRLGQVVDATKPYRRSENGTASHGRGHWHWH